MKTAQELRRMYLCVKFLKIGVQTIALATVFFAGNQMTIGQSTLSQPSQLHEYWVDPATGLMWAAKDNGKDINWRNALKFCRDLRLATYSDWRLANMFELQGIYDKNSEAPGFGVREVEPTTWHVKGNIFLTAYEWSSNFRMDDHGRPNGYAYYFDFNDGKSDDAQTGYSTYKHALCVRGTGDPLGAQRPRSGSISR